MKVACLKWNSLNFFMFVVILMLNCTDVEGDVEDRKTPCHHVRGIFMSSLRLVLKFYYC